MNVCSEEPGNLEIKAIAQEYLQSVMDVTFWFVLLWIAAYSTPAWRNISRN